MRIVLLTLLIFGFYNCLAQQKELRKLPAVKVGVSPILDGDLSDTVWQHAAIASGFIINQPEFGKPASQATEVRIIYNNTAIYIGAYLHDDPKLVRRQLTARDGENYQNVDMFGVAFDTYNDNQNAFQFKVSAANVQSDMRLSASNDGDPDYSWDAVWDSRVKLVYDGWIVEMMIPYMALRFSDKALQDWGINFYRFTRRSNENAYWNTVDPKVSGYVNQFGDWTGVADIKPPVRLSFLPYLSGGYRTIPDNNGTSNAWLHNGGMDVKYGVNESFTLDMTLIPDFGQVQSDNLVLNLSPYEVQFSENRPFFTEGTELFNKAGIFYSRRVGGTPSGYYDARQLASDSGYSIVKNPSTTQLYNATKFSGRTRKNLGIGIFNAVTAPMDAVFKNKKGDKIRVETEPLANYNIIVLDQAFKNRSYLALTNTNVTRSGHARDANVTAIDLSLFNKKNTYNFSLSPRFSYISGTDAHNGFKNSISFEKVSGKWQYGIFNNIETERYDPNDLGYLQSPNEFSTGIWAKFQQFTPNKHFNFRNYNISIVQTNLLAPFKYSEVKVESNFTHVFRNFWDITLEVSGTPGWSRDYFDMRTPGLMVRKTPYCFAGLFGSTDSRKKLYVYYGIGMAESPTIKNDPFYLTSIGARYRFNSKFSLDLSNRREDDKGNYGFSHFDSTGKGVLGLRRIYSVTSILSGTYNFKARMSFTARARHYWSKVRYRNFYDVQTNGWWHDVPFEEGHNYNYNAFNIDAFFTWDFRLGSRFIIAWKNAIGPDVTLDGPRYTHYGQNLNGIFSNPHSNELTFKFVYFIDYNQLVKKGKKKV